MTTEDSARLARAALLSAMGELVNKPLKHHEEFEALRREIAAALPALEQMYADAA